MRNVKLWTKDDVEILMYLRARGVFVKDIAKELGRSENATWRKLVHLGMTPGKERKSSQSKTTHTTRRIRKTVDKEQLYNFSNTEEGKLCKQQRQAFIFLEKAMDSYCQRKSSHVHIS